MRRKIIILSGMALAAFLGLVAVLLTQEPEFSMDGDIGEIKGEQRTSEIDQRLTSRSSESEQNPSITVATGINESRLAEQILEEVSIRLGDRQFDEALNEISGLLDGYDDLSDIDKSKVLQSYARYFLSKSQIEDAYFFYESILELSDLGLENRLAFIQILSRVAIGQQDWRRYLAYNDQYFAEGGEYNCIVADNLVRAYRGLDDNVAAAEAFLQYLETGINPVTIESEERYQRWVGIHEDLPLQVSNTRLSLALAESLAQNFGRKENLKVLAEIYASQGDDSNYARVLDTARSKGFLDEAGNWTP